MANKVTTLIDVNTQDELYPRTKVTAVSDANGNSLDYLLDQKQDTVLSGTTDPASGTGSNGDVYIKYNSTGGTATLGEVATYNAVTIGNHGTAFPSAINVDLLWTNASPTSDFAEQTITSVDLSEYAYIIVQYALSKSYNQYRYLWTVLVDGYEHITFFPQYKNWNRSVKASTSSVYFSDCNVYNAYANTGSSVSNDYMIPLYIYGVR